ncbi:MAG: CocE/NonD family hydrolase [Acidobacteria bacterium]|nr:MAG: CocE/NonD family hydrolase [Acidobacteriota bacterium]REK03818.1 MAG: CocE/NonD family hydrolase [Acidobacteriota bacterium]
MMGRGRRVGLALALVPLVLSACGPAGQGGSKSSASPGGDPAASALRELYGKQQAQIPMRDGVTLNTEIYAPLPGGPLGAGPWPLLLTRTPYGLSHDDDGFHRALSTSYAELVGDGYVFVFQDIRGRYGSQGEFAMLRPPRASSGAAVDEASDTFDTIEWLLPHVPGNNGRVGMLGISYGGWLTAVAMLDPHPALTAASPQASPADMFLGDDFAHNGAFRLSPSFGYVALMESGRENAPFDFDQYDVYEWYLEMGPYSNVDRVFGEPKPTWELFMDNPSYTDAWKAISLLPVLARVEDVEVPALHVAGWWDAEDFFGPLAIYQGLEPHDARQVSHLVVGPWRHGGWARGDGASLGAIEFGSKTAEHYRREIERRFFAHHLHGPADARGADETEGWSGAEAIVFETGRNRWRTFDAFPPKESETRRLYLHPGGSLGLQPGAPDGAPPYDEYISDPADPVPYMPRPIPGFWQGGQALWKVTDQRFADHRPDVLSWQGPPLEEDLTVCGDVRVHLVASTSGADSDWIVKLIDVYPEQLPENGPYAAEMAGFQLMVADEVFRARFRDSFENPSPVPAGVPLAYDFSLGARCHTFLAGHALMVQVQSTWFPLIGRNPQTWVEIPEAVASDYRPATQRIWRDPSGAPDRASFLELPVLGNAEE